MNKIIESVENKVDEKKKILSLDVCKQELDEHYPVLKKLINDARSA
ncbi:hypothetical protein HY993_03905 [Candidatus Micrarchaeota archaeon]|nr:hypothetical protein [Candidatus Micrarchaeota archaeon]